LKSAQAAVHKITMVTNTISIDHIRLAICKTFSVTSSLCRARHGAKVAGTACTNSATTSRRNMRRTRTTPACTFVVASRSLAHREQAIDPLTVKRRLTCILAADAVGFSAHVGLDEEGTLRILAAHRAVIDGIIAFHGGRVVGTAGDSVLAEFSSAVEAVRCAVEIQDALRTRNESLPEDHRLQFRIGVNLGDVVVDRDDLLGDGVNVAARLESIAEPGGVCIASSVYDQITGKLNLGFVDIGDQSLKNISRPIHVYRVAGTGPPVRAAAPPRRARPALPWLAGIAAVVVLGLALAWSAGWLGGRPRDNATSVASSAQRAGAPAAVGQGAPAAAQDIAAEAQRLAEARAELAKSKAEAESAALRAKAEADAMTRARAEIERAKAQATRTQAEAERAQASKARRDAETQAKTEQAQRDADAQAKAEQVQRDARGKAQGDVAPRAGAGADGTVQARSGDAVASAAAMAAAKLHPGRWGVTRTCETFEEFPRTTEPMPISVRGDTIVVERGTEGKPGYMIAWGRVSENGELVLVGNGVAGSKRFLGNKINVRFAGPVGDDQFVLTGKLGRRDCFLAFVRLGN